MTKQNSTRNLRASKTTPKEAKRTMTQKSRQTRLNSSIWKVLRMKFLAGRRSSRRGLKIMTNFRKRLPRYSKKQRTL